MDSVLILGASSDVGKALAVKYAQGNYEIYLAGRNSEKLDPLKSDIEIRYNTKVFTFQFDAENYHEHVPFVEALPALPDIVICVFGYLGKQDEAQGKWSEAEKIINTNYTGAVSALECFAARYEAQKSGTIVGISSVAGERGRQSNYFYGSSKAAFTAYLSGLRNRLYKSKVHVVTVKPGFIDTKMTAGMDLPGPLTASPEQVSNAIFKAVGKKKNTIYVLGIWRLIMYIIKTIPEPIFKRLKL